MESSPTLRNKKDLIDEFVESLSVNTDVDAEWERFVAQKKHAELVEIIKDLALRPKPTESFMDGAFRDGAVPVSGTAITKILPPTPRFRKDGAHAATKRRVVERLLEFFERYRDLG